MVKIIKNQIYQIYREIKSSLGWTATCLLRSIFVTNFSDLTKQVLLYFVFALQEHMNFKMRAYTSERVNFVIHL